MPSTPKTSDLSPLLTTTGARLVLIERTLRRRQWTTTADFMNELGISRPTLKRDIKTLREVYGASIQACSSGMGYQLIGDWPGVLRHLITQIESL